MWNLSNLLDLFWDVTEICNKKKASDQQFVMEKRLGENMGVLKLRSYGVGACEKYGSFEAERDKEYIPCLSRQLFQIE